MSEQPYYAKDGIVWKASIETKHADQSSSFTLAFPVCSMSEAVGDDAADAVANLMNAGAQAEAKARGQS